MLEILSIIFILIGLLGSVWAWRGRRVGDHPYCRKCGFDLFGSPESMACPECGRDVSTPKARRIGLRRRRPIWLALGLALLLLGGTGVGVQTLRPITYADILPHLPGAYLLAVYETDAEARDEVIRRIQAGGMSQSHVDQAVADALVIQQDRTIQWDSAWGHLIEAAWATGRLSQADGERYLTQAFQFTLMTRPTVQVERAPQVHGFLTANRLSENSRMNVTWRHPDSVVNENARMRHHFQTHVSHQFDVPISLVFQCPKKPVGDQPGQHQIDATILIDAELIAPGNQRTPLRVSGVACHATPASIQVVRDTTGQYVSGEAFADRMANKAWIIVGHRVTPGNTPPAERFLLTGWPYHRSTPDGGWRRGHHPLAYLRIDGEWVELAPPEIAVSNAKTCYFAWSLRDIEMRHGTIEHADVLLRLNVDEVETRVDVAPAQWLGELLFHNVPLAAAPSGEPAHSTTRISPAFRTEHPPLARPLTLEEAERSPAP